MTELELHTAINAIKYLLNKKVSNDFITVFKHLYFADMQHLTKYGRTITSDNYVAMRNGPVPSYLYDVMKYLKGERNPFVNFESLQNHFNVKNYNISVKSDINMDYLSETDIECLDKVISELKSKTSFDLSEMSHGRAYSSAVRDDSINIIEIAKEGGANSDMISHITELQDINSVLA